MNAARLTIYNMGRDLLPGSQLSGRVCPFCEERGQAESSLSVVRNDDNIAYRCHRAKCGAQGWVPITGERRMLPVHDRVEGATKYASWLRCLAPVRDKQKDWLKQEWGFEEEHVRLSDIRYSVPSKRLAIPIYDVSGREVGFTLRSMDKSVTPKSLIIFTKEDALGMAYYKGNMNESIVLVVEDQASAVRASKYCTTVALLGVHFDGMRAVRLLSAKPTKIIFCLDNDAFNKSVKYASTFRDMFDSCVATCPTKDLKNMEEAELKDFLSDVLGIKIAEEVGDA